MQRLLHLLSAGALLLAACGGNDEHVPDDAAVPPIDAPASTLAACLDRPTDLLRPPSGQLPCELIPPGVTLRAP